MKHFVFCLTLFAFCTACNNSHADEEVKFVKEVDTTATQEKPQEDTTNGPNLVPLINAQDTVFEDGTLPSAWWQAGFNNSAVFKIFIYDFKTWVKENRADSIAAHIKFPLKNIATAEQFKNKFNELFDTTLKQKISQQRLDRIFRNKDGAMICNGAIWFKEIKGGYFITAINTKQ